MPTTITLSTAPATAPATTPIATSVGGGCASVAVNTVVMGQQNSKSLNDIHEGCAAIQLMQLECVKCKSYHTDVASTCV